MKHLLVVALSCMPLAGYATEILPVAVTGQIAQPLKAVGSGIYTKLGFTVYRATLWTPSGIWKADEPYALQIHYKMSLSQNTIVETVVDNLREQQVAGAAMFARWEELLTRTLPAVYAGDSIIGLAIPGKASTLIHNGKVVTTIADQKLSTAFFNIWLGKTADKKLRRELLP